MLISELGIKGFKSYGNNETILKLNTEKGELILLVGANGAGKSVIPSTKIDCEIPIELFSLNDLIYFLDLMGVESRYILYLKENNKNLYEEYVNHTNAGKNNQK